MITADPRVGVHFEFDEAFLTDFRKEMFNQGISMQEFFSYIIQLAAIGDNRIYNLIDEYKHSKSDVVKNNKPSIEVSKASSESLFNLIEKNSPFNKPKGER